MKPLLLLCAEYINDNRISIKELTNESQEFIKSMENYKDEKFFLSGLIFNGYYYFPFEIYFKFYYKPKITPSFNPSKYYIEFLGMKNDYNDRVVDYWFTNIYKTAIYKKNYEVLKFISTIYDFNNFRKLNLYYATPIQYAIEKTKDLELVKYMLDIGYDVNHFCILSTIIYGCLDILKVLIEKNKNLINQSLIYDIIANNQLEILKYLHSIYKFNPIHRNICCIQNAIKKKNYEILDYLELNNLFFD